MWSRPRARSERGFRHCIGRPDLKNTKLLGDSLHGLYRNNLIQPVRRIVLRDKAVAACV